MRVLLEELHMDGEIEPLVNRLDTLTPDRYAQAVALALVLRHSWTPNDMADILERLAIGVRASVARKAR